MTSIALALFIIFIVYVMIWSIKNDGARSIGEQTGYIRMLDPTAPRPKSEGRRGHHGRTPAPAANGRSSKHR